MKFQVSMDDELLARVDDYCARHYLNRSDVINLALVELLDKWDECSALIKGSEIVRKIALSGEYTDWDKAYIRLYTYLLLKAYRKDNSMLTGYKL